LAELGAGIHPNVGVGSRVLITRSGDVIPTVSSIVENHPEDNPHLPTKCPICGSAVAENGAFIDCQNAECSGKEANRMRKFLVALGVKGLGQDSLVEYANAGVTLLDFFLEDNFAEVERKITAAGTISLNIWCKIKVQLNV
jgi:NAD-dependent DNA ligase